MTLTLLNKAGFLTDKNLLHKLYCQFCRPYQFLLEKFGLCQSSPAIPILGEKGFSSAVCPLAPLSGTEGEIMAGFPTGFFTRNRGIARGSSLTSRTRQAT